MLENLIARSESLYNVEKSLTEQIMHQLFMGISFRLGGLHIFNVERDKT